MAIESNGLLDEIGRNLLSALEEDARLSYAELGRRIGLSPAATAERLRRLEEAGIITGYRVEIDREAIGLPVLAIVRLSCDGVKYRPFLKAVQAMERVMECHHVAGGDAFVLKVVAESVTELGKVVEKLLDFGVPTTSIVFSSPVARRALKVGWGWFSDIQIPNGTKSVICLHWWGMLQLANARLRARLFSRSEGAGRIESSDPSGRYPGPGREQGVFPWQHLWRGRRQSDMQTYCVIGTCGRLAALCAYVTALGWGADPALTIYNQNFAVIRETLPLDLKAGNNTVRFSGATAHVEPDSVILRDPAGKRVVQVVEQNYRNDAVSQELLLNLYEGKTIEFSVRNQDGSTSMVTGKIVRSGYVPHYQAMTRYGAQYQANQMAMASQSGGVGQPIIEVGGKLQFNLPGQPIFPALADDTILKPAFDWILYSAQPAKFAAELSYVSGGMSWT